MLNTEKTNRYDRAKKIAITKEETTKHTDRFSDEQSNKQFSPKNKKQKAHSCTGPSLKECATANNEDQDDEDF